MRSDARAGAHRALPFLAAGDVLAGRFRILRTLGRGGTGEVYEAEDVVLRTTLALKVLRPDAATDQGQERFRREVLLARRVTHPHVCRVFDLYEHTVGGDAGGTTLRFLTMELLRGETLAALLARRGRLPVAEALPLARQMAAALGAAHRADVVHRDFKSANVVLVPEGEAALRAVVTDFGLARALEIDESSTSRSGPLVGTCAYMSPEQVEGGVVGAAADVYAFGIVLYEMVTGRRPFRAETALATAMKRMHELPPPPTRYAPELDSRWEAVILRCLARDAKARFARPEEVASALEASAPAARASAAPRASRWRQVGLALVAASLAALLFSPAAPRTRTSPGTATLPAATAPRKAVAVVGFTNLSRRPDTGWLSTALAEMLRTELTLGGKLRTIPGENVARMKMELALSDADTLAGDTLARVRANVGADVVILGSYLHLGPGTGGRIRLEVRAQDAATGETTAALTESGTEAELFDLVSRLGAGLREGLGEGGEALTAPAARRALPARPEALQLYAEGLGALRSLDGQAAARILQRAVDLDADAPLVRAALSEAWAAVGSDRLTRQEAEKAYQLSASLRPEERRWVEGRFREATQDWRGAVQAYSALWASYPDEVEYGLRLAAAQTSMGRPREAVATAAAMRRIPGAAAEDPRIDLVESEASLALADFELVRRLAVTAGAKGRRSGARLLVGRALLQEARALERLGDKGRAAARLAEAMRLFTAAGDRASASWTNVFLGLVRASQGEPAEARLLYARALDGFDALGHRRGHAAALTHLAVIDWKQGRLDQARARWEDAMATFRDVDDRASVARLANNLAVLAQNEGDLDRARGLFDDALEVARQVGDKRSIGAALANVADVTAESGDLRGADKLYDESLGILESIGLKGGVAMTLYRRADLRLRMGDLAGARSGHTRALAVRQAMGEKLMVAESRLALARVDLEEGRPREAQRAARATLDEFRREEAADDEALAHAVLARALSADGRGRDARAEAAQARRLGDRSANQLVRLSVSIATAAVDAEGTSPAERDRARRRIEAALTEARRSGRRGAEMDARLALAQAGTARGGAGGEAAALVKTARSLGYGLVARKAASLPVLPPSR